MESSLATGAGAGVGALGAGEVGDSRFAGGGAAGDETGDADTVFADRLLSGDADPTVRELVEAEV